MYAIRKFAELTGVTTKALRHYERVGLLAPTRTTGGYRRYGHGDFARIERILALKSLGLPLRQIGAKEIEGADVRPVLREHRATLERKRLELDAAIQALRQLENDPSPDAALQRFIGEMAWERWERRRHTLAAKTPRAPDRAPASRLEAFQSLDAALTIDASSEDTHARARRCRELVDPETFKAWRLRRQWPSGLLAYVASCYDMTPAGWERIVACLESYGTR